MIPHVGKNCLVEANGPEVSLVGLTQPLLVDSGEALERKSPEELQRTEALAFILPQSPATNEYQGLGTRFAPLREDSR